jgi:hypothetical protein
MREYASKNGTQYRKIVDFKDNKTGEITKVEIDDYYEPYDPEEYIIIVIDHIGLISTEKKDGKPMNIHESIVHLSSNYLIKLRNKYNYIPVVIQQQASAQESIDNLKANRLKPTLDGLGDCKLTQRDANVVLGLFSPFRHEIKNYYGYDTVKFRDHIRFLEVLADRGGKSGTVCPLYFDGATNYFKELPLSTDTQAMNSVYQFLNTIK